MLINAAQKIERLTNVEELWEEFRHTVLGYGIKHYIYLTVDVSKTSPYLISTMDMHKHGQSKTVFDPFLDYCCGNYDITRTGSVFLSDYPYLDEASKQFIEQAAEYGFTAGLGIPMRLTGSERYGGFNLGTEMSRDGFTEKIWPLAEELRLFCLIVHRRVEELHSEDSLSNSAKGFRKRLVARPAAALDQLSHREREVAYLISRGYSRKQAAQSCNIAEPTISTHLKHAYRKLNVTSKAELTRLVVEAE